MMHLFTCGECGRPARSAVGQASVPASVGWASVPAWLRWILAVLCASATAAAQLVTPPAVETRVDAAGCIWTRLRFYVGAHPADHNADGVVSIDDTLLVLGLWERPYSLDDLLIVLAAQGQSGVASPFDRFELAGEPSSPAAWSDAAAPRWYFRASIFVGWWTLCGGHGEWGGRPCPPGGAVYDDVAAEASRRALVRSAPTADGQRVAIGDPVWRRVPPHAPVGQFTLLAVPLLDVPRSDPALIVLADGAVLHPTDVFALQHSALTWTWSPASCRPCLTPTGGYRP